jgi:hypothetical protein
MNTANGKADACKAKIKKLVFGFFQIEDVDAVIVPNLGQPLMGMNVLQMFNISQDKGEMQISYQKQDKAGGKGETDKPATGKDASTSGAAPVPAVSGNDAQSP